MEPKTLKSAQRPHPELKSEIIPSPGLPFSCICTHGVTSAFTVHFCGCHSSHSNDVVRHICRDSLAIQIASKSRTFCIFLSSLSMTSSIALSAATDFLTRATLASSFSLVASLNESVLGDIFTNLDFPEIRGFPLLFNTIWGENSCEVTIIWPEPMGVRKKEETKNSKLLLTGKDGTWANYTPLSSLTNGWRRAPKMMVSERNACFSGWKNMAIFGMLNFGGVIISSVPNEK